MLIQARTWGCQRHLHGTSLQAARQKLSPRTGSQHSAKRSRHHLIHVEILPRARHVPSLTPSLRRPHWPTPTRTSRGARGANASTGFPPASETPPFSPSRPRSTPLESISGQVIFGVPRLPLALDFAQSSVPRLVGVADISSGGSADHYYPREAGLICALA